MHINNANQVVTQVMAISKTVQVTYVPTELTDRMIHLDHTCVMKKVFVRGNNTYTYINRAVMNSSKLANFDLNV